MHKAVVNEIEEDIKIYPNPGQSFIYLDIEDVSDKSIKGAIYDLMGRKISEHNISSGNNKINIEKLTIGTYLLKIQLNKKSLNFKIIKSTF